MTETSPLSRAAFIERFGTRAVFGMVHMLPLPGSPLYGGSIQEVIDAAGRDATAIIAGGADGIVFENFGDRPFHRERVGRLTVAAMTRVILSSMTGLRASFGVNVLRNDPRSALAVAAATGASFIRVNIHTGAMLADQGIIEGDAARTLRLRTRLGGGIAIFADHMVKHATPLADVDPAQSAKDLRLRGLADAVIVSGIETGATPDARRLRELRTAIDAPLLIGSGLTEENAHAWDAEGAIVGTAIKRDADVALAVDAERVRRVVARFKSSGGQ